MKKPFSFCVLLLVLCLAALAPGQKPAAAPPSESAKITKAQADELFRSVDEIVKFVSRDTGLPIKAKVDRHLASRDEVQTYVEQRMAEDEDQKRLERSELVLKKLGMLPADFQLRKFLVSLLREQVAAYYDVKKKAVFMLDWLAPETQKPIMAHELTHALQDQDVDLEKWLEQVRVQAKKTYDPDNADAIIDEQIGARSALVEGQGMAVLVDYSLAPTGQTLADVPQLVDAIKQGIGSGQDMPILSSAPLMLQESLMFPYRDGLGFVAALLKTGGKKMAYADALQKPPRDTRQILTPSAYVNGEQLPPMPIPDLQKALGNGMKTYDAGSIGQFDIQILAKQFGDASTVSYLPQRWRGGYYWSTSTTNPEPQIKGDLKLVVVSRWADGFSAGRFAELYRHSLAQKYKKSEPVKDAPESRWQTEEGPVSVLVRGNVVVVTEGFSDRERGKIESSVFSADAAPAGKTVSGNLSMHIMRPFYTAMLRGQCFEPRAVPEFRH